MSLREQFDGLLAQAQAEEHPEGYVLAYFVRSTAYLDEDEARAAWQATAAKEGKSTLEITWVDPTPPARKFRKRSDVLVRGQTELALECVSDAITLRCGDETLTIRDAELVTDLTDLLAGYADVLRENLQIARPANRLELLLRDK